MGGLSEGRGLLVEGALPAEHHLFWVWVEVTVSRASGTEAEQESVRGHKPESLEASWVEASEMQTSLVSTHWPKKLGHLITDPLEFPHCPLHCPTPLGCLDRSKSPQGTPSRTLNSCIPSKPELRCSLSFSGHRDCDEPCPGATPRPRVCFAEQRIEIRQREEFPHNEVVGHWIHSCGSPYKSSFFFPSTTSVRVNPVGGDSRAAQMAGPGKSQVSLFFFFI